MKKYKKLVLIIILFLVTLFPTLVFAKTVSLQEINSLVEQYYDIEDKLEELDCRDNSDYENVSKCTNANINKSLILSKIFKYCENSSLCDNATIQSVLNDNKDNCSNVVGSTLSDLYKRVSTAFYILGPFLLIIFGSLDFAKIVAMSDPETLKKSRKNFSIRLTAFVILMFLPQILNIILSLNASNYDLKGEVYNCKTDIVYQKKNWRVIHLQMNSMASSIGNRTIVYGGITNDADAERLNTELTDMLHTVYHDRRNPGIMQQGPFPKWWNSSNNGLSKFQCTWWAKGRASQYLEQYGTVYKEYPTEYGNGGDYYSVNKSNGYFKYGQTPKPNSIISWKQGGEAGHVAYVEGVGQDGIYISHAGSGSRWFGVQKISLDGIVWPGSGYTLNGYIYLDEPIQ